MKIVLTYILVLLISDIAAPDPDKVVVNSNQFPVINLESNTLGKWINDEVLLPRSIQLKKDHLLVLENDLRVDDQLIKIFSLSQKKMVGYYGRSGSGPGEIRGGLQVVPMYGADDQIGFLDFTSKRFSVILLEEILKGEHYKEPAISNVLPPQFIHMQYGTILNDSLIVGGGSMRDGKLLFGNYKTNEYKLTDFIPEIGRNYNPGSTPNIYLTQIAVNKNKEKVVVGNLHFNQIEIYNYNGDPDLVITGDYSDQEFDDMEGRWHTENTIEYYRGVITTDDYIMAIYYNMTDKELRSKDGEFRKGLKSNIRVFDWEGTPIVQYNLDRRVTKIAYDEQNERIIALDTDSLNSIIEYNIDL